MSGIHWKNLVFFKVRYSLENCPFTKNLILIDNVLLVNQLRLHKEKNRTVYSGSAQHSVVAAAAAAALTELAGGG